MEKQTYNLVELFSGIGSQAKALKNLGITVNLQGTSEWDIHALSAYDIIHNGPEIPLKIQSMSKADLLEILKNYTFSGSGKAPLEFTSLRTYSVEALRRIYTSIVRNKNYVDVTRLDGTTLPNDIDILTYSFPCQDLSNVGAFHGYNKGIDKDSGSRSSLLWQVGRILTELRGAKKNLPRFLLLENVPSLLSKRHFDNFKTWIADLEALGYISQYYQLNASDFGLPQNRPRLLMISVFVGDDLRKRKLVNDYFQSKQSPASVVEDYRNSGFFCQLSVRQLLRTDYSNKKLFAEALECAPNDTVSRKKIWDENPQIILEDGTLNPLIDTVRTITTKQDRNPNSGNLYFDSGVDGRSKFRYLTPRECLLFMGFTDDDFKRLKNNNLEIHKGDAIFSRDKIIRMAGNSIPVKLLEGVFNQVLQIDELLATYHKQLDSQSSAQILASDDYDKLIRSFMFKNRIRSRIGTDPCPGDATIVYPKYKTAIYIKSCFLRATECTNVVCSLCSCQNLEVPYKEQETLFDATMCSAALALGWQAIIVKECELQEGICEETLQWILKCLKMNQTANQPKIMNVPTHVSKAN